MTYPSDKLPALSGVIATIQRQTNDVYYAGIWKSHFLAGLLWRLEDPESDLYVFAPKKAKRLDFWRAPSWSFAAVEGVVRYELHPSGTDYCAQLEECSLVPSGTNLFGELEAGFVRVRGPMSTLVEVGHECTFAGYDCGVGLLNGKIASGKVFFDFERYGECKVLMISLYAGLALTLAEGEQDRYVRVGVVQIWSGGDSTWLSAGLYGEPVSIVLV
jgi:hypothetical protein